MNGTGRRSGENRRVQERERDLFRRFLRGDNGAFHTLFTERNQSVFNYCLKLVGNVQVAEDMLQETWIRVIGMRGREEPEEIRNPVGLLIRIARNLCLDYLKSRRATEPLNGLSEGEMPSYRIPEQETGEEIVGRCLQRLPFDYRETLVLNIYSGYSFEEIAVILDKSPEAIWARASRARRRLRELVEEELRREERALKVMTRPPQKNTG